MLTFPPEIYLLIAEHLTTTRDLSALLRTHSHLRHLLTPRLYTLASAPSFPRRHLIVDLILRHGNGASLSLLIRYAALQSAPFDIRAIWKRVLESFIPIDPSIFRYLLLQPGIDINIRLSHDGSSAAFQTVAKSRSVPLLDLFVEHGLDLSWRESRHPRGTFLHLAVARGHLDLASALLAHDIPVGITDDDGMTPLHTAVMTCCMRRVRWNTSLSVDPQAVVQMLLDKGADISATTRRGETPLYLAAKNARRVAVVRILLENGAGVEGGGVLMAAARRRANRGQLAVLKELVNAGADLGGGKALTEFLEARKRATEVAGRKRNGKRKRGREEGGGVAEVVKLLTPGARESEEGLGS
ncbi:ankyrin repeat-containing domain protein [Trichophaea hybrida]|nr:ankyrin repeat-containing domain protein [Trichophaea hybrida]